MEPNNPENSMSLAKLALAGMMTAGLASALVNTYAGDDHKHDTEVKADSDAAKLAEQLAEKITPIHDCSGLNTCRGPRL